MKYPLEQYDDYLCLKISIGVVLTILFSIRHLLAIPLAFLPMAGSDLSYLSNSLVQTPYLVFTDIPGLLVFIAWMNRNPKAGSLTRTIWQKGRFILTIGLSIQLAITAQQNGLQVLFSYYFDTDQYVSLVSLFINFLAIYYLWRSARVAETFSCFPETKPPQDAPASTGVKQ